MSHGPAATATKWIQGYKNNLRKVSLAKKENKTTIDLINLWVQNQVSVYDMAWLKMMFSPTKKDKHCTDAKKKILVWLECIRFNLLFASTFSVFIGVEYFCTPIVPWLGVVWIWFPFPLMFQTLNKWEKKSEKLPNPTPQQKINKQPSWETYRLLWIKIPWGRGHILWDVRINLLAIFIHLSRSKTGFPCFLQFKLLPVILSRLERDCRKCT